jgi:eukaryotic-like serine/threonine-protein kinase
VREGPYAKVGTITGIFTLILTYLALAYTTKWIPFQDHTNPAASIGPTATPSSASSAPGKPPASLDGAWVAQLASVPLSAGVSQLNQMLSQVRQEIAGAGYLDSSQYGSLNPGYWMIYYRGSFRNGNEALAFCASHGRATRDQCIGRLISHKKSDGVYMCFPPEGTQIDGCYHD